MTNNRIRFDTFIGMDVALSSNDKSDQLYNGFVLMKKYWKLDLLLLSLILIVGIVLWPGARGVSRDVSSNLKGYGGRLTSGAQSVLLQMNNDLRDMKRCVQVHPQKIVLVDQNKKIKTYSYAYGTLWCDEEPIMTGVRSFFFEYRNAWGYLLPRASHNLQSVESVGYTVRVRSNGKEVVTTSCVKITYSTGPYGDKRTDMNKLVAMNF